MKNRPKRTERWKRWAYLGIVAGAVAGAAWLLTPAFWSASSRAAGDVVEIKGTMGGFSHSLIRAKAGRPLTVRLTSVDNRFHTDGGGKHQFAIDGLGVNIIAPPLGTREATFTPTKPGVYEYYCDVCCGGRANPTMQGKLIVEAWRAAGARTGVFGDGGRASRPGGPGGARLASRPLAGYGRSAPGDS